MAPFTWAPLGFLCPLGGAPGLRGLPCGALGPLWDSNRSRFVAPGFLWDALGVPWAVVGPHQVPGMPLQANVAEIHRLRTKSSLRAFAWAGPWVNGVMECCSEPLPHAPFLTYLWKFGGGVNFEAHPKYKIDTFGTQCLVTD